MDRIGMDQQQEIHAMTLCADLTQDAHKAAASCSMGIIIIPRHPRLSGFGVSDLGL